MTVEFFDLAQRFYAARAGHPVRRIKHALAVMDAAPIVVRAEAGADAVPSAEVSTNPGDSVAVRGSRELVAALAQAGVSITGSRWRQLIVPDTRSLNVMVEAAREHRFDRTREVAAAAAVIGWWADQAAHPGTCAVINLLETSRLRFITGNAPAAERDPALWLSAFGVSAGITGLWQWAQAVTAGPYLDALQNGVVDDHQGWSAAAARFSAHGDWAGTERAPVAAMALRRRCDAADWWDAALRTDVWWRHRSQHTGHLTGGEIVAQVPTGFIVRCERLDARLRQGNQVCWWVGGPETFQTRNYSSGEVREATAEDGALLMTITGMMKAARPSVGQWASVMARPPLPQAITSGMRSYSALQFSSKSWITSGKTPPVSRRDVPLDILVAAAERDDLTDANTGKAVQ